MISYSDSFVRPAVLEVQRVFYLGGAAGRGGPDRCVPTLSASCLLLSGAGAPPVATGVCGGEGGMEAVWEGASLVMGIPLQMEKYW